MSKKNYLDLAGLTAYDGKIKEWFKSGITDISEDTIRALFVTVAEGPADNEIWYTTVDESIIETTPPIDSEWGMMFGTKMVSNTYENEIGIMKFEDDLTFIGPFTFTDNKKLKTIILPSKITRIETFDPPFHGCTSLISIVLPDNLEYIGDCAFVYCSALQAINIPNNVTTIGSGVFEGCSSLTSPLYNAHCFAYMPTSYSGVYAIPEGIEQIAGGAFGYCSGLTSITIPDSVKEIGGSAFYKCSGLTSIIVEDANSTYDSRENCNAIIETATNTLIAGCQNTIIPDSVTSIGTNAFVGCSGLTSITIPDSVTSIGTSAFDGCSSLTSITFEGTIREWIYMYKGSNWNGQVPATYVQCSDGQVTL